MSLPITGCPDFDIALPRPRGGTVVRAVDFGLSETSNRNQDAIHAALAEAHRIGASRVELSPGTYRCFDGETGMRTGRPRSGSGAPGGRALPCGAAECRTPEGGGIRINGFEDFVFDGCGATLVFRREHEPTDSQHALLEGVANIEIRNCRRTVVEHFQMDWDWETDPLAFWCVAAEKHVDEADNASYVDFDLDHPHPKFPEPVPVQLLNPMRADRTGPILRRGRPGRAFCGTIIGHTGAKSEWISSTRLRVWAFVRPERGHVAPSQERVYSPKLNRAWVEAVELGTTFAIAHRYYGLNGIVLDSNEDFTLRDVDIWACWGMGVETRGSQTRWQLERVNVRPKPGCKYPVTSTADAHHVVQSRGYGRMVDCEVTMNQDDFLNLHDRTTVGRTVAPGAIEIVNSRGIEYTLLRVGSQVGLKDEDFSDTGWAGRIERIEGETVFFDRDLPPQKGRVFVVYDRERATENFLFRNCWFHDSPGSRGLVQGRHITFEGCVFGPMKGTPLKLHSCYTYNVWCEGIGCEDVVVRGCRFENAIDEDLALTPPTQIYAGLSIPGDGYWTMPCIPIANAEFAALAEADRAAGRKVAPSPEGVCRILIEGNTFVNPPGWIFYAKNGSEFIVRGNTVEWRDPPAERLPFAGQCRGVRPMPPDNTSPPSTTS